MQKGGKTFYGESVVVRHETSLSSTIRSAASRTVTKHPLGTLPPAPTSLSPGHRRMVCGWFVPAGPCARCSSSTAPSAASRRFSRSLMAIRWACEMTRQVSGSPRMGNCSRATCTASRSGTCNTAGSGRSSRRCAGSP